METATDWITAIGSLITALLTSLIAIIGYKQFTKFNNQVKADFIYRIYQDMLKWLGTHGEARNWIYELSNKTLAKNFDRWELDDFISYFEILWSYSKKHLVEDELVYDLFSDYIIHAYEAENFALEKRIKEFRVKDNEEDLYEGVEFLYHKLKEMEEKKLRAKK